MKNELLITVLFHLLFDISKEYWKFRVQYNFLFKLILVILETIKNYLCTGGYQKSDAIRCITLLFIWMVSKYLILFLTTSLQLNNIWIGRSKQQRSNIDTKKCKKQISFWSLLTLHGASTSTFHLWEVLNVFSLGT